MNTKNSSLLKVIGCSALLFSQNNLMAEEPVFDLGPYSVVVQGRTLKTLSTLPQTISLVDQESWNDQLALSPDPIGALSQLVPSYSPSRQKMTGFGETFRGRSPLFMVDGIPQSNPLRDGSRDGYTIDSAMIERVEVIHGASAAQGLGATGGIINFVTISPPTEDGSRHTVVLGTEVDDELSGDGVGYSGSAVTRHRSGALGYAASVSYKWRPMQYDGDGNLVGIDNTQGDTMNSHTLGLFGKVQYEIAEKQSIELMLNRFELEQEMEYVSVNGNPALGLPTSSRKGETPGKATVNEVLSANLTYTHAALFGGNFRANAFFQDFAATYGGGTFGVFQLNGQPTFDQSQNESEKHGLKLSFARDLTEGLGLVAGVDTLSDKTRQVLVQTGRVWVPESTYQSVAPYLQLEQVVGPVVLSGGLRYEDAKLEVGDFTTLEAYGSQQVEGGSPDFSEWLLNLGLTWETVPGLTLFASYSQGFGMPDVGRVLRGIDQPGLSVDSFLNLQPIVTDNYELGFRRTSGSLSSSLSLFFSGSDLGSRLSADADGIFSVNREKTETYGIEFSTTWRATEDRSFDARFAIIEGKFDADNDGSVDTRLDGTNIPPARLNLAWMQAWTDTLTSRLQTATYFDRDAPTIGGADFSGYTLIDLLLSWSTAHGRLDLGIANLLDKQYITYYSQTSPGAGRYFAGRGRSFSLRWSRDF